MDAFRHICRCTEDGNKFIKEKGMASQKAMYAHMNNKTIKINKKQWWTHLARLRETVSRETRKEHIFVLKCFCYTVLTWEWAGQYPKPAGGGRVWEVPVDWARVIDNYSVHAPKALPRHSNYMYIV
jgi:hypothetical protein